MTDHAQALKVLRKSFNEVCNRRDELAEEVERLQKALNFWLPSVDPNAGERKVDRVAHDAYLLAGYDGELEDTAEEIGWIKWTHTL